MGATKAVLLTLMLVPFTMTRGQAVEFLQSLVLGSGGDGTLKVSFNEKALADVHASLVEALGVKPKTQVTLSASKPSGQSLLSRFASVYAGADSNDLFVGVCVAGWKTDPLRPGFVSVAGFHRDTITADYLLNFLQFLPTYDGVIFMIFPSRADFPPDIIKTTGTKGGGGKYFVVVRTQERTTFENLVEAFLDALEESRGGKNADVDKDSFLSFSEWLQELSTISAVSKVSLVPYKISDAPDLKIRQLK